MKLLQFPTCWPMKGLFCHWSRDWGVLSFSERLAYHKYFILIFPIDTVSTLSYYYHCQPLQLYWQSFIKNKCLVPPDMNFTLDSHTFSVQAIIDHHGIAMSCGHYTASVYCCGTAFYFNDDKITVCDIHHTRAFSTTYIMIYKLRV